MSLASAAALLLVWASASLALGGWREQQAETFRVEGAVERAGDWTTARLATEFASDVKTVTYNLKGEKGEARCVPLLALLQAAKPRLNPKIKNHQLAFVALARAEDLLKGLIIYQNLARGAHAEKVAAK